MQTAKELHAQIAALREKIEKPDKELAGADFEQRVTNVWLRILALSLQLGEISTRRIVRLTWALLLVTIALLAFAAVQTAIMLHENRNADSYHIQAGQHNQTQSTKP
ncbi:MAG: hypothetical protein ABSH21_10855 [Verrucomicrobiia bacterium]